MFDELQMIQDEVVQLHHPVIWKTKSPIKTNIREQSDQEYLGSRCIDLRARVISFTLNMRKQALLNVSITQFCILL